MLTAMNQKRGHRKRGQIYFSELIRKGDRFIFTGSLLCKIGGSCTRHSDGEFELIKINLSPFLLIAGLVFCAACSTVQQAPVEERQETDIETDGAAWVDEPATPAADKSAGSGFGRPDDAAGAWVELPRPGEPQTPADVEAEALAEPGRLSENSAVIALLDDTDLRLSQGDAEGAASSVERALRLEPGNPWLWHRLALLRFRQGEWRQAIALAEKSNSLSARHPEIRKANAELIKRAEKR